MGDALERIEAAIAPLRRRRTQLRISTVATFASHWLIPRLASWQDRHPDIELAISTSTRSVDFATEDFDCAIRHGLGQWKAVTSTLLFQETLVPVARPGIASISSGSTLIRARSRFRDWHRWWQVSGQSGKPPERNVVVETRAQAMDAALAGVGIAMMDRAYAVPHLANGGLCALGKVVDLREGYYLTLPVNRPRNARSLARLCDWLVDQAAGQTDSIQRGTRVVSHNL
jgi:LysR family glycine cleavage system transcriptional activator